VDFLSNGQANGAFGDFGHFAVVSVPEAVEHHGVVAGF
jgi:hypothetical protein